MSSGLQCPQLPVALPLTRPAGTCGRQHPDSSLQSLERRGPPELPSAAEWQRGGGDWRGHQSDFCPHAPRRRVPFWRAGWHPGPRFLPRQGCSGGWHTLWWWWDLELWRYLLTEIMNGFMAIEELLDDRLYTDNDLLVYIRGVQTMARGPFWIGPQQIQKSIMSYSPQMKLVLVLYCTY